MPGIGESSEPMGTDDQYEIAFLHQVAQTHTAEKGSRHPDCAPAQREVVNCCEYQIAHDDRHTVLDVTTEEAGQRQAVNPFLADRDAQEIEDPQYLPAIERLV